MKKTFFLLLSAVLLAVLMGCQKPNEERPPALTAETTEQATETERTPPKDTEALTEVETEPQTEPVTEPETELPTQNDDKYCGNNNISDLEVFLHDLWERQAELGGDVGLNSQNQTVSVLVPVLKNDNYELRSLTWTGEGENEMLRWIYQPVEGTFEPTYPLQVYLHYGITDHKELVENRLGLLILNEEYCAGYSDPKWYFEIEGYSVCVGFHFHDDTNMIPFERVFEYFDFEIVTYSPAAETDPVQ